MSFLSCPDDVLRQILGGGGGGGTSFVPYRVYSRVCRRLRLLHPGRPVAVVRLPRAGPVDARWVLRVPLLRDASDVQLEDCSNEQRRARFIKTLLPSLFPADEDEVVYRDPEPERLQECFPKHPADMPKPEYTLRPLGCAFVGPVGAAIQRADLSAHLVRLELADLRLDESSVHAVQQLSRLEVLGLSMVLPCFRDGHPAQLRLRQFPALRELYCVEPEQLAQRCVDARHLTTSLRRLHLSLASVMPDEIAGLARLTRLRELALVQASLPGGWERAVRPLSELEILDLRWCSPPVNDRNAFQLFARRKSGKEKMVASAAAAAAADVSAAASVEPRPFPRLRKLLLSGFAGAGHVTSWHSEFVETFWRACLMINNAPVTGVMLTARGLDAVLRATHGQLETLAIERASLLRGRRPARALARETQLRELNVAWSGGGANFGIDDEPDDIMSVSSSDGEDDHDDAAAFGRAADAGPAVPTEQFGWLRPLRNLTAFSVAPTPLTSFTIEQALNDSSPLLQQIKDDR